MKKTLLALICCSALSAVFADTVQPYDGSSTYFNFNTGIGKLYDLPSGEWTGNINWGYNFNRGFALEGGYNVFSGSQFGASVTTNIVDVAAKGTVPLSDAFSLYGRAGIGYGNNSWSGTPDQPYEQCILCNNTLSSNFGLLLVGAGGSFTLTRHWDLRLEDTMYFPWSNTYTGSLMAFTFGSQYNF